MTKEQCNCFSHLSSFSFKSNRVLWSACDDPFFLLVMMLRMAPGSQSRFNIFCHESTPFIVVVYHWLQRTLSIRFCYHNNIDVVSRALGLSSVPGLSQRRKLK